MLLSMDYADIVNEVVNCKDCTKHSDCTYTCCKNHSKMACEAFLDLKNTMLNELKALPAN